jgi:hypothetical protein
LILSLAYSIGVVRVVTLLKGYLQDTIDLPSELNFGTGGGRISPPVYVLRPTTQTDPADSH